MLSLSQFRTVVALAAGGARAWFPGLEPRGKWKLFLLM